MSIQKFVGSLAVPMDAFCALRRLSGTDYKGQACLLGLFDQFLVAQNFNSDHLSADLIDRYMSEISHLKPRSQSNRLCVIRQFCIYLRNNQPNSYVPERRRTPNSSSTFQPYIFTLKDVRLLIAQARKVGPPNTLRGTVLATIIGLLFATGLRIGEALALNLEDFSPDTSLLEVRKGKFRKQRLIRASPTTCEALQHYIELLVKSFPLGSASPLFVNLRGKRLRRPSVAVPFVSLLHQSGIYSGSGQRPRLHDLRHSFAVRRLLLWYQEGGDINSKLPSLATYMGHVNISSTQVYIHATPQLKQEADKLAWSYFQTHVLGSGR